MIARRGNSIQQYFVAVAAVALTSLVQLSDGRAAAVEGLNAPASGDKVSLMTDGIYECPKAASVVLLRGGKAYWDRTNSCITFKHVTGGFFAGTIAADAASADTTVYVNLNVTPAYRINMAADQLFATALVGSATAVRDSTGSRVTYAVIATSEAEKSDAISNEVVAIADGPIFEARFTTVANGSTSAVDISLGLANATHASDADAITEHVLFHIDGGSQVINAQSKDGTTTVAAVTTTVSITDGTFVEFWIDARDPTNVQLYLDGVRVLSGSTFKLNAGTGPMKALCHIEKSTGTATGSIALEFMRVRSTDLALAA